jgi:hypothetical protein
LTKEERNLTAELFKTLGVGWSGSGHMATIYENGAAVGFGLVRKDGNLTAAYLKSDNRFYAMTSNGLRAVGHMTTVGGIRVAVIHGKPTNALGVLASAAGATFISNGGPLNIWKGPNGEIHGSAGTRLFVFGKNGFTALRVYENRGRLYVEGSYSRQTFQRVQSDGTVINVNVRQGTYAVMDGKGHLSFKNEFAVNYGGVVGKLSDLPAGTVLRVELMGKLTSVTLGAAGGGLRRSIQDVTMAGPGGTKIIVREIGVVGVKASGAAGAGVDPRTITNGALVPTGFGVVSAQGKVTAEFRTGADGALRMVSFDIKSLDVRGDTMAFWMGGEFKTVTLAGATLGADGNRLALSFAGAMSLSQWGNIDRASLTGMSFDRKSENGTWVLAGFNGSGQLNVSGTLIPVVFTGGKLELMASQSTTIKGVFETVGGTKTLEFTLKDVVAFDALTGQVTIRARLNLGDAVLDIPAMKTDRDRPSTIPLAADKPVDVMVQTMGASDRYQSQVGKNGSMDVVMPVLSQREGEAAPVMKSKDHPAVDPGEGRGGHGGPGRVDGGRIANWGSGTRRGSAWGAVWRTCFSVRRGILSTVCFERMGSKTRWAQRRFSFPFRPTCRRKPGRATRAAT